MLYVRKLLQQVFFSFILQFFSDFFPTQWTNKSHVFYVWTCFITVCERDGFYEPFS